MDAWSLMHGDALIHFVSGSRRVNIRLGVLLLIPKSPQSQSWMMLGEADTLRHPDTNKHVIQRSGCGSPTSRAKSAKNSSMVLFCRNRDAVKWWNTLNASVAYAVMRALFISSGFALYSLFSFWYTARAPPRSRKTCSTVHSVVYRLAPRSLFDNWHVCRGANEFRNQPDIKYLAVIAKEWQVPPK